MKSQWSDTRARDAVSSAEDASDKAIAVRLYTARLIGENADLVLHGGGNVSVKDVATTITGQSVNVLYIKASGRDLATLDTDGLVALELAALRHLRATPTLDDQSIREVFRRATIGNTQSPPSIETPVHAFLDAKFVDHSHADAILALTNQPNGAEVIRDALGGRIAIVPYIRPGLELAIAVANAVENSPDVEGVVLIHHGLITFGDTARTSYDRHIALVDACETYINQRSHTAPIPATPKSTDSPEALAAMVAPILRGLLAHRISNVDQPYQRPILEWRASNATRALIDGASAHALAASGPLAGDHVIHTKPQPLFLQAPSWADPQKLKHQLVDAVETYRRDYTDYVLKHGGSNESLDTAPRVVMLPGAGLFCWGPSKKAAAITADIAEHTLATKARAHCFGTHEPLPPEHLFDMEFRAIQRDKIKRSSTRPLEGHVVVISGGAGAIGIGIAKVCALAGAHIALADIESDRLSDACAQIERAAGANTTTSITMDVTDEASVRAGFAKVVRTFGGVDVVVPNAGIGHVAAIDEMEVADFRRVFEVNAVGYLLLMREGAKILKQQGLGGHIVVNASKNVFGPGKQFGAYSASKAAGHQLGKVAAIELAPFGIRVNMINADGVFGDEHAPSGLWKKVGPSRAKSRNISEESLPEFYRDRNLLKTSVLARHVGNAVLFFASNATPTTGATIPVDGGLVDAFPR